MLHTFEKVLLFVLGITIGAYFNCAVYFSENPQKVKIVVESNQDMPILTAHNEIMVPLQDETLIIGIKNIE